MASMWTHLNFHLNIIDFASLITWHATDNILSVKWYECCHHDWNWLKYVSSIFFSGLTHKAVILCHITLSSEIMRFNMWAHLAVYKGGKCAVANRVENANVLQSIKGNQTGSQQMQGCNLLFAQRHFNLIKHIRLKNKHRKTKEIVQNLVSLCLVLCCLRKSSEPTQQSSVIYTSTSTMQWNISYS